MTRIDKLFVLFMQSFCGDNCGYQHCVDTHHTEHFGVVPLHSGNHFLPGPSSVCCLRARYFMEANQ